MKKCLQIVLFFIFLTSVACQSPSSDKPAKQELKGASDGGGGEIAKSTPQQVRDAFDKAYEVVVSQDLAFHLQMFAAPSQLSSALTDAENKKVIKAIMFLQDPEFVASSYNSSLDIGAMSDEELDLYFEKIDELKKKYSVPTRDLIKKEEILFLEDKACPAADKSHADASVDKFDVGAKVCFSVYKLTRLPLESLERHIAGLIAHELTHIFGFEEKIAQVVQEKAVSAYTLFVKKSDANEIFYRISHISSDATFTVMLVESMINEYHRLILSEKMIESEVLENKVAEIRFHLGYVSGLLKSLENFLDEANHITKLFKDEAAQQQAQQILAQLKEFDAFLKTSNSQSDEIFLSLEYFKEFTEKQEKFNRTGIQLGELLEDFKRQ